MKDSLRNELVQFHNGNVSIEDCIRKEADVFSKSATRKGPELLVKILEATISVICEADKENKKPKEHPTYRTINDICNRIISEKGWPKKTANTRGTGNDLKKLADAITKAVANEADSIEPTDNLRDILPRLTGAGIQAGIAFAIEGANATKDRETVEKKSVSVVRKMNNEQRICFVHDIVWAQSKKIVAEYKAQAPDAAQESSNAQANAEETVQNAINENGKKLQDIANKTATKSGKRTRAGGKKATAEA